MPDPTVRRRDASVRFGSRTLWGGLDLDVAPGEFVAVLGPNGGGKTTLLKVLLGLQTLTAGTVQLCGRVPHRGSDLAGYIPQHRAFDRDVPMRGRDLVRFGRDGHRWGIGRSNRATRDAVEHVIAEVGAQSFADAPLGTLSGGEQQRLRIAQALLGDPRVLLCDEPLLSLDLQHQQITSALIDERRRRSGTSVLFVTHEINPILPFVDRVLYLVGSRWTVGAPDDVMTTECLSALYGARIDVLRVRDRIVVVGAPDSAHSETAGGHHHAEGDEHTPDPADR